MNKFVWAGLGAGVLSLAGLFGVIGRGSETPTPEEPSPITRYLQDVTARIEAQEGAQGYRFPREAPPNTIAAAAFAQQSQPVQYSGAVSSQLGDRHPSLNIDSSFDGRLRRAAQDLGASHIGSVVSAYHSAYQMLKDEFKGTFEERDALARSNFGMGWDDFLARADAAYAQQQQEMTLKVDATANLIQGVVHLNRCTRGQLRADLFVLGRTISHRTEMHEDGTYRQPSGTLGMLDAKSREVNELLKMTDAIKEASCGGLQLVEVKP